LPGKADEPAGLENSSGDILVLRPYACREAGELLRRHHPDRRLYAVREHNDLNDKPSAPLALTHAQARLHRTAVGPQPF